MVQDGKITTEQGEVLIKAVLAPAQPIPPTPPQRPVTSSTSSSASHSSSTTSQDVVDELQSRLGDLQHKIGEVQAKLGAAQSAGGGKITLPFGLGEVNVGKIMDEAVKGMETLRSEAVRGVKTAARQAEKEGQRMRKGVRRSGRSMRIEVQIGVDDERPRNRENLPQVAETQTSELRIGSGALLLIDNSFGDIAVKGSSADGMIHLTADKSGWAASKEDARKIVDSAKAEPIYDSNGNLSGFHVTSDESLPGNVTVDLELSVPNNVVPSLTTTFGDIECKSFSNGAGHIESVSGDIHVSAIASSASTAQTSLITRTGAVAVEHCSTGDLKVETTSSDVDASDITASMATFSTRSGGIDLTSVTVSGELFIETVSGDAQVKKADCEGEIRLSTKSGDISLATVNCAKLSGHLVSGDLDLDGASVGEGGILLESVSGDLGAEDLAAGLARLRSVSGDVSLEFSTPFKGDLQATTVSGDVVVKVPEASDATVQMVTQSGDLTSDAILVDPRQASDPRSVNGTLGAGTGSVKLHSVSGDISVKLAR
jgi:DUF4097 and DUF4098 domain-containing protein YvlB